jgi:flagellar basal body rod protein FlgC
MVKAPVGVEIVALQQNLATLRALAVSCHQKSKSLPRICHSEMAVQAGLTSAGMHANFASRRSRPRAVCRRRRHGGFMNAISSTAVSGVQAASARLNVSSHNIANANTPNFQRQVVHQSQETAGVVTSVGKSDEIGVDLATEIVEQQAASYAYKANLRTIRTQEDMMGSLLDVKA